MTMFNRRTVLGGVALAMGLALSGPVWAAESVVNFSLWDKGDVDMATGLGLGLNGDMSKATMGITIDQTSVKAGEVTLRAVNDSTVDTHEMVVAPIVDRNSQLPYDPSMERVDEEAAGSLGEVSELDPGASGSLTLTLKPGEYVLYCNIPGHYMSGMWTPLTVTG